MSTSANLWKPKRERRSSIYITHEGKTLSLSQWARESGLCYETILSRYQRGVRGAELFVPTMRQAGKDWKSAAEDRQAAKAKDDARKQASEAKTKARHDNRQKLLAEHQAAFSRPLIDAKLLKPKERQAIAERVKFSGQLNWRANGGATF